MEIWKPIARFNDIIEVSNIGRVRRVTSFVNCRNGHKRIAPGRILKPKKHPWGYDWFEFSVGGNLYWEFGHRLVAEAFIGPCPKGHYVLHADNVPNNNNLSNLRYGTPSENCIDKLAHGTQPTGEKIPWHKLKEEQIEHIRCRRASGENLDSIAKDYSVTSVYIWQICTGKKWPNAGGPIEGKKRKVNILSEEQRQEVLKLRKQGFGIHKLALMFETSNTQIHNLVRKHEN